MWTLACARRDFQHRGRPVRAAALTAISPCVDAFRYHPGLERCLNVTDSLATGITGIL